MMRELRKRMAVFLWFVAAAFILFIFLQWGMNISGRRQPKQITTIAKVNGISISTRLYAERLSKVLNSIRDSQNLTHIDPLTERIIEENVFEELVQEVILKGEMRKNNISISQNEIIEILKNSPPQEVLQDSSMYTNGKYDPQKYLDVLRNPANKYFLYEQENRIRDYYPRSKLNLMYTSALKVTQTELLKFFQEESIKIKVSYIPFRLEDYLHMVTLKEGDARDYYAIHKEEYETSVGINLRGVAFDIAPSLSDEMEAKREIDDIYNLFKTGIEFDTLAATYSQDGNSNSEGGDLGFIKKDEVDPEIEKVAFSLKKGEVSTPFQSSLGWHLLKVTDITRGERRISHILIRVVPGYETVSQLREKMSSFKDNAKETDFEETAKTYKLEVLDVQLYEEDGDLVPDIGRIIGINNFLFGERRKENTLIGPFVGYDDKFYIFMVGPYIEERIKDFEEVREEMEKKVKREKACDLAKGEAQRCFDEIKKGTPLLQAAVNFSKKIHTTDYFSMKDLIPGVPYSSEFYGLAFTLQKKEIGITSTEKGSFIVSLLNRKEVKQEDFEAEAPTIFTSLILEKRENIISRWLQDLRENAKIKDNRHLLEIY
jgi:peptidyl-prolyl cis-trans isomerase D